MFAVKANKQYKINELQKETYLADGFDIVDDNGQVVEYSPSKKVSFAKYMELVKENAELKAQLAKNKKA